MCTVKQRAIRYELLDQWVANVCSEIHSNPAHQQDNVYWLVTGDGSRTISAEDFRHAKKMFDGFHGELVRHDEDDCLYELDDDADHEPEDEIYRPEVRAAFPASGVQTVQRHRARAEEYDTDDHGAPDSLAFGVE